MATYYVSPYGNDSYSGLAANYSGAALGPWLTPFAKPMNTGSPVLPGDTVKICPATYYNAIATPVASIASTGSPTLFLGDTENASGFLDPTGQPVSPGRCWITTRTAAEGPLGQIATNTGALIVGSTNNPSGIQLQNLTLEANLPNTSGAIYQFSGNAGIGITIMDCYIVAHAVFRQSGGALTAGLNHAVRRSDIICTSVFVSASGLSSPTADADLGIVIEENWISGTFAGPTDALSLGAAGGNIAGGIYCYDNIVVGTTALTTTASRVSTLAPIVVKGNLIFCMNASAAFLNAGTLGQIVDAGNNVYVGLPTGNTNVPFHASSQITPMLNLVLPHLVKWGLATPRIDVLGWDETADVTQRFSASGRTTSDYWGRTPRPWGAGSSVSCFQSLNAYRDQSSQISTGGQTSFAILGAGERSIWVPVDPVATTITVVTKSTAYVGTNYPQVILQARPQCGVAAQTVTATDSSEQTLTIGPFTPTDEGAVELRFSSRNAGLSGQTNFDVIQAA